MNHTNDNDVSPSLRAAEPEGELDYAFGPFRIDASARRLLRGDVVVPLAAKVFDTLVLLVKNQNAVVTKKEIARTIWPNTRAPAEGPLQNISAIRRALGDDSSQPVYIATLAGHGYRFIAPVEALTIEGSALPAKDNAIQLQQTTGVAEARRDASSFAWGPPGLAVAALVGLVLGSLVTWYARATPAPAAVRPNALRFQEALPPGQILEGGLALSPDGLSMAFVAQDDESGARRIWLRVLNGDKALPIQQTDGASAPFWSPDGRSLGYSAGGRLTRIAIAGGAPHPIVGIQRGTSIGGSWGKGDQILYVDQGKIFRVSASGGAPVVVVDGNHVGPGELRWPHFLPDGRHFVFVVNSDYPSRSATYLGDLSSHQVVRLMDRSDSPVVYTAPGYLVYIRDRTLWTQRFDASDGKMLSDPTPVVGDLLEGVDVTANGGYVAVAQHRLGARALWADRLGKELETFKVPKAFSNIRISPDGHRALATSTDDGTLGLWQIDLDRHTTTHLVENAGYPAWAPDGTHFAYVSVGSGGAADLHVRSTIGADDAVWLKNDDIKMVTDWSRDGRFIVFANANETARGVWLLPAVGEHKAQQIVRTPGPVSASGRLSPDGRAIAYVSDENGTREVYVESMPAGGQKYQVSSGGGVDPVWGSDGRELDHVAADRRLNAVAISGDRMSLGKPEPLFSGAGYVSYAAAADGRRFLVIARDRSRDYGSITVLTNAAAAILPPGTP